MLVLTRRIGEEIVIAGDIQVVVLSVSGGKVRLGITAPSSVGVLRKELLRGDVESTGSPSLTGNRKQSCVTAEELP